MHIAQFMVDPAALEEGTWVKDLPDMGKLRLCVRGFGNTDDEQIQQREYDALPREMKLRGVVPKAERDRILGIRLRDAILVNWDGLDADEQGTPLPYSKELADKLIHDGRFRPFREAIVLAASIVSATRAADVKDAVKN